MSIIGIDVSHYNGPVDWHAAADSISFAFVKATQGTVSVDPRFAENWRSLKAASVPRGAYHFYDPSADGQAQARLFLHTVRPVSSDLPPVLDIETMGRAHDPATRAAFLAGVKKWLVSVNQATGQMPVIYTSPSFWQELGDPPCPGKYPLWIAHYGVPVPRIPRAWAAWAFWQFSQEGRCSGIEGHVDLNRFHSSLDDLKRLSLPGRPISRAERVAA